MALHLFWSSLEASLSPWLVFVTLQSKIVFQRHCVEDQLVIVSHLFKGPERLPPPPLLSLCDEQQEGSQPAGIHTGWVWSKHFSLSPILHTKHKVVSSAVWCLLKTQVSFYVNYMQSMQEDFPWYWNNLMLNSRWWSPCKNRFYTKVNIRCLAADLLACAQVFGEEVSGYLVHFPSHSTPVWRAV